MELVRGEIRVRAVVLVKLTLFRILEQHRTTTIGLQSVLVGINNHRIRPTQRCKGRLITGLIQRTELEIPSVRGIGMDAGAIDSGQLQNIMQRVNGAHTRSPHRSDDGGCAACGRECLQGFLELAEIHTAMLIGADGAEFHPQHLTHALMRVVTLGGGEDLGGGLVLAGDPERLEVCDGAAGGEVAQGLIVADHRPKGLYTF